MKRILLIYNPRSSQYSDVQKDVLSKIPTLKGYIVGKYEIAPTNVDDNITKLAKILKDDDLVISAGGDATGVIASNAILKSGKDATLAVLPYGNFNDLSRTLGTKTLEDIFSGTDGRNVFSSDHKLEQTAEGAEQTEDLSSVSRRRPADGPKGRATRPEKKAFGRSCIKYYPLEIYVDGKFFRYATCYVTIGMTAEAVKLYDSPIMRKKLKTNLGRKIGSYTNLASWYFKNRHKKVFLPEFRLNGELQPSKTSDYAAINGRYMARVMRGGEDYLSPKVFRSETYRLTNFWRLFKLMSKSILFRIPSSSTTGDTIEFLHPATVELQAEGEYCVFENIYKIEIRKSQKYLKTIKS